MSVAIPPAEHPHAARIVAATGTPLATWVQRLDDLGARELDHAGIARALIEGFEITDWWAQGVTVAYEQVVGRRVVGQSCRGDFSASASRTLAGTPDEVRESWDAFMTAARRAELGIQDPSLTDTEKWRYWRAGLVDGSRLSVNITAKDEGRSTLSIEHKGLDDADARAVWKDAWKRTLTDFTTTHQESR
ncbi:MULTISPECIES: hypothetical protein [unclassified Brachybacterium]|uniref:hypothetical protein n=1 Tax=unclassified Brachybacterium TaxID=2623841 RepID=UPI000C7F98A4|nr:MULTISPECIES: hypothetical protein [unclassified Brachybacterium]PMC75585.1 hypothetical protein CJ197_07535 [Brachybacterium sp. UMB0905]